MRDLHPEIDIREDQAEAIARGLYAVARADGEVHPREAALITSFYGSGDDTSATLSSLERLQDISSADLAAHLPDADLRQLFLKTAMLLAYADGNYSAKESQLIAEYGKALNVGDGDMRDMELQVKEFMLSQLSSLENTTAVAEVAKGLKI
jgi:tellurite resistance protein